MSALLKIFKTILYAALFLGLYLLADRYGLFAKFSSPTRFTVTADTKIIPGSELSKYVTQEEVDDFAFRYSNIRCERETNSTLILLKSALESKDTAKVLKFIKDNNLSVDVAMRDKRTPLMHSSFYNDVNTTKALLDIGADIKAKDIYGLNPLAYAITFNSVNTVKLLLSKGAKFEDVAYAQYYLKNVGYPTGIEKLIITNTGNKEDIDIEYVSVDRNDTTKLTCKNDSKAKIEPFRYAVMLGFTDMAKVMLENGYQPKELFEHGECMPGIGCDTSVSNTSWVYLDDYPNYEPMLELLLKYDVIGQPTKEELRTAYEECYDKVKYTLREKRKTISIK